jgi:hypothetical protein
MVAVAYATGRASRARQVKGGDPDKKEYPGPQGWRLGVRSTTPPRNKILLGNLKKKVGQGPPRAIEPMMMMMMMVVMIWCAESKVSHGTRGNLLYSRNLIFENS